MRWLDRIGLKHRAQAYHELSGGGQQRVAGARPGRNARCCWTNRSPASIRCCVLVREVSIAALAEARTTTLFVTHDAERCWWPIGSPSSKAGICCWEAAPRKGAISPTSVDAAAAQDHQRIRRPRPERRGGDAVGPGRVVLAEGAGARVAVRAEALVLPGAGARAGRTAAWGARSGAD
ncbi:MAG: hypothetical protein R3C16_02500 [Hyphomonadaceae bacterium]